VMELRETYLPFEYEIGDLRFVIGHYRRRSSRLARRVSPPAGGHQSTCTTGTPCAASCVAKSSRPRFTTRGPVINSSGRRAGRETEGGCSWGSTAAPVAVRATASRWAGLS